jgi:hypothetical protein
VTLLNNFWTVELFWWNFESLLKFWWVTFWQYFRDPTFFILLRPLFLILISRPSLWWPGWADHILEAPRGLECLHPSWNSQSYKCSFQRQRC